MTGDELRAVRHELGLIQGVLARVLRVAPDTLARWERDEHAIPWSVALVLMLLTATHPSVQVPMLIKHTVVLYGIEHGCIYCGATDGIVPDHVIPRRRGGSNNLRNLVPACGSCNPSKRNKTLAEWGRSFLYVPWWRQAE